MWDILILTAGSEIQKCDFELQLEEIEWLKYARECRVVADFPEGTRIGSGGATMEVLHCLHSVRPSRSPNSRILLFHSGGLSQRMPHLSAYGKLFARLTSGKTMLETKLEMYRELSSSLPPGVLISASDVIEDVTTFRIPKESVDVILFAHESSIKVAEQHGVYVMDGVRLISVLQKPSEAEMRRHGAVRENGTVLTDSMFWLSSSLCEDLRGKYEEKRPIHVELCAYSDFLRPLGTHPLLEYIEKSEGEVREWRDVCRGIFQNKSIHISSLGPDSFFHFGTISEFLEHADANSSFGRKFLGNSQVNVIHSEVEDVKIPKSSFVEFSDLTTGTVGENSIVSGLQSSKPVVIPDNTLAFTISIDGGFVTVVAPTTTDFKKDFWSERMFPIGRTREESLEKTLELTERKMAPDGREKLISLSDALREKNLKEMVAWRRRMSK